MLNASPQNAALADGARTMKFLLELMRILHTLVGITPAEPEHERTYLLLWSGAFALIIVAVIAFVLIFMPRIMH
jgi:hypothetical protein